MSQCYAPNAVPVPEYGPCNPSESISLCCSPGQICLTNGLCATQMGQFYSGACTDRTYKAAICPSFCMGAKKFVVECHNSVIPDGGFCCDGTGEGTCCGSSSNQLKVDPSVSSAVAVPAVSSSAIQVSEPRTVTTSASTTIPSSSATASTRDGSLSVTTSINTPPPTVTSTLIPVPSNSTISNDRAHSRTTGLKIGIPTAIILGIVIILILLLSHHCIPASLFNHLRRKRTKTPPTSNAPPDSIGNSHPNKSGDNVFELEDLPAPAPELPDSPSSTLVPKEPPPSHSFDGPSSLLPPSRPGTLSSIPVPLTPTNTGVTNMDGAVTPPSPTRAALGPERAEGSPSPPVSPLLGYERMEGVRRSGDGDAGDEGVWVARPVEAHTAI